MKAGDEAMAELKAFAQTARLNATQFTGIGAFEELTVGFFNPEKKDYNTIVIREQVEVLSLLGDISLKDGEIQLHAHVVVGKADGTAHGGHLMHGIVRPTLELVLIEAPSYLRRKMDLATGLTLIDLEA
jgi:predicted DNA-binding protein with PD1-like motif